MAPYGHIFDLVEGRLYWKKRQGNSNLFNSFYVGKEAGGSDPETICIYGTYFSKSEIIKAMTT